MVLSLRARLLAWVLLPLAGAVAVDGGLSFRNADATASVVQDRLLLGAARIVAEELRWEDGTFQPHIPPAALELFDAADVDRIYYRVTTEAGEIATGYDELPLPRERTRPEVPLFFAAEVRGEPVRVVAFLQPVLTDSGVRPVLVEFAQTLHGQAALARGLWLAAMGQQFVLLALVAALILCGLRYGLQPLLRLRDAVLARQSGALEPLPTEAIPSELLPLVTAINEYARRLHQYAGAQEVFIQNAAHQLRTPLTLLNTQISFATRTTDQDVRAESLAAIRQTVQQAARLVHQLLTLSAAQSQAADDAAEPTQPLDAVVRQVLEDLAGQAQAKNIDLGFERVGPHPILVRQPLMMREIVMNLVDNAIRYTPRGGVVTTRVLQGGASPVLVVEDNGPGIEPAQRERVFERFYRIDDGDSGGCGLGLSIVRQFADRIGAQVTLGTAAAGQGLAVTVVLVNHAGAAPDPATALRGAPPHATARLSATQAKSIG